ncbi:MAG: hypothetical protein WCG06_02305 [Candidatus Omnitrophota bacterium]
MVEKPAPKVVDEVKPPAQPEKPADQKTQQQQERPQSKPPQEASKPQGLTGQDKISTQLMARTRSFGALLEGMTSFEASGTQMGAYMKNVKERVWLSWFPYLAFQYPQDYRSADAVIGFTLDRKGNVKSVQILENYGSPLFAAFCVDAVQKASGFGPVPDEILALTGQDQIDIRFGFHYR